MRILPIRKLLLLSALSLYAAAPAAAQSVDAELDGKLGSWTVIDRTDYGTIYLDTAHVAPVDADVYEVRTRWRFARVQTDHEGDSYRSSVAVRAINCRSQQMAILAYADYDESQVVHLAEQPRYAPSWDSINPGSVVDRIAAYTCARGRRMVELATAQSTGG